MLLQTGIRIPVCFIGKISISFLTNVLFSSKCGFPLPVNLFRFVRLSGSGFTTVTALDQYVCIVILILMFRFVVILISYVMTPPMRSWTAEVNEQDSLAELSLA